MIEVTPSKQGAAVPPRLAHFQRYTIEQVAVMLNITSHYLWQCIRASRDEKFRKKRKISMTTLRSLPINGWFQQGREWMIIEADLLQQVKSPRR